jgi:Protein of unknown function (DUF3887)
MPPRRRLTNLQRGLVALGIFGILVLLVFGVRAGLNNSNDSSSAHSSQTAVPSTTSSFSAPATTTGGINNQDTLALDILDEIVRGDYAAATTSFDAQMHQKVSTQLLADSWKSYQQTLGAYESHGDPQQVPHGDLTIVNVPLQMQQEPGQFRVTFHSDGTVAGLLFLRAGVPVPGQ